MTDMRLGEKGLKLIKKYEGLCLIAYKAAPSELYYTIGYGHCGPDVKKGMWITEAQAEAYLLKDCASAAASVNRYGNRYHFNQNQFDALVSFTYNCGAGNLNRLTACGLRSLEQIGDRLTAYNKAGGKAMAGLTRRRQEEQKLFDTPDTVSAMQELDYTPVFDADYYIEKYPDLKKAFDEDRERLLEHFVTFGMREHRQGNAGFEPVAYRKKYVDLDKAFGDVWELYYLHYLRYGIAEGRTAM